jgi:hypothetical protein
MHKTAMLLGFLSVACTAIAQEPGPNADLADRVRAIRRQILDLETIGRNRVLQERSVHTVASSEGRAAPGQGPWLSRATLVKALEPSQRRKRQDLMDELAILGAPGPSDIKSGPQVGEGGNGRFLAMFLNGGHGHAGKQRCPV